MKRFTLLVGHPSRLLCPLTPVNVAFSERDDETIRKKLMLTVSADSEVIYPHKFTRMLEG